METIILIAVVLTALFVINVLSGKIQEIHFRFESVKDELLRIRKELELLRQQQVVLPKVKPETPPAIQPENIKPLAPEIQKPVIPKTADLPAPAFTFKEPVIGKTVSESAEKVTSPDSQNLPVIPPIMPEPVYEEPQPGFVERFMQNNPDLEKFIGENLINKIGIAILVLGIGYFVKFAIDKDWINEIGRVFIGILAGGLLIGVAHRMRKTFAAFSSVLVGGGLSVLYFTIAIAFHEYHIFNQTAAFLIMVVITGFSVLLSVSYNRVELAVLALLGGFATPFMVSTGEGNYQVLFTYILILDVGMLVLAYLKGWKIINWISYGFTVLLYGGWLSTRILHAPTGPYVGALIFATLFYVVFFLMNIINNLKKRTHFVTSEIGILLSNTFFYYSAGMAILLHIQHGFYQGLFTVAVAVFNFAFAFILFRNQKADRNLVYLLIGLVITFISLAIPVQLEGNYITLFWALEAVLLLWFAQKTGIKLAVISSVVISGLMLISLVMDWNNIYLTYTSGASLRVLLNKGFITGFVSVLSLIGTSWLLKNNPQQISFKLFEFDPVKYRTIIAFVLWGLIYCVLLLELNYQLNVYVESAFSRTIILGCFNLSFIISLFAFAKKRQNDALQLGVIFLGMFGVALYALYYNVIVMQLLKAEYLQNGNDFLGFPFHYLSLILTGAILFLIYKNRTFLHPYWPNADKFLWWGLSLVLVYLASSELLYHVLYFNLPYENANNLKTKDYQQAAYTFYQDLVRQTYKVGFPILWGVLAFTLMYIGLKKKNKYLRIISLSLFSVTLLKLFLFDIRGISEGGKIAAFICLGILLLVISFMYQNIKKLILADEKPENSEPEL